MESWRQKAGNPGCARNKSSFWSFSEVLYGWSHRKGRSFYSWLIIWDWNLTFQLHLFKCTKEEEIKNTLKKHIYFVSIRKRKKQGWIFLIKTIFASSWRKSVQVLPVYSTVLCSQKDLLSKFSNFLVKTVVFTVLHWKIVPRYAGPGWSTSHRHRRQGLENSYP